MSAKVRERATIRVAIAVLLAASVVYALFFVEPIVRTAGKVLGALGEPKALISVVVAAVGVLLGHLLRAWRDRLLFREAADTTVRTQLGAFSVGSLCNAVLPLKLGELVRADVVAQRYRVSFSFSLVLVLFERLVDCLVLLALSIAFIGLFPPLAIASVALAALVGILWRSPRWFKGLVTSASVALSDKVRSRVLFVFWSLEYGLRRTLVPQTVVPYVLLALVNWAVYVAAFVPALIILTGQDLPGCVEGAVGAYVALTTAVSPAALGSYTPTLAAFGLSDPVAYIMLWMAAVVPVSLVGMYFALFKLRDLPLLRGSGGAPREAGLNRLSRIADVSSEQASFLRDYFAGEELARGIAAREIGGEAAIMRYFAGGGSGAVTYLSSRGGELFATKTVSLEKSAALREQFAWLRAHEGPMVACACVERESGGMYSIDVGFESGSVDGFDYIHASPAADSEAFLDAVIGFLADEVWLEREGLEEVPEVAARKCVEDYIAKHVEGSLSLAAREMPSLEGAMAANRIIVNGEECRNVAELLKAVRRTEVMADLCSWCRSASIHGDLILDNVIWSPSKGLPVLLDPVPCGNFLDGPVFDFGKLCQSLQVGYEFMLRNTAEVSFRDLGGGAVAIDYANLRSAVYERLWRHVRDDLAPAHLTGPEQRTMLFLGATNFLRRMKHQAVQCPANALAFYAAGVLYLERYVRMFEGGDGI